MHSSAAISHQFRCKYLRSAWIEESPGLDYTDMQSLMDVYGTLVKSEPPKKTSNPSDSHAPLLARPYSMDWGHNSKCPHKVANSTSLRRCMAAAQSDTFTLHQPREGSYGKQIP
jgi:hypothetical protein